MGYQHIKVPHTGEKITVKEGKLNVPEHPIVGFVEGDGIGPDITKASMRVWNAAVEKAYEGRRKIHWCELFLGEKASEVYGGDFFPKETLQAIEDLVVAIKGPLTTPVGGGFRSLNVSLRQDLDLYACVRPVRYYQNVPSPLKEPDKVDVVIFRENTEDVYAGIEYQSGSEENRKLAEFLRKDLGASFFEDAGLGIKPISPFGSKRLIRKAIQYAIDNNRESVTLVHKGNIMKYTEGAFRNWGYEVVHEEFRKETVTEEELYSKYGGKCPPGRIVVKDRIADITFQLLQLRPAEFDVLATMNLNGDYLSDAVAAEVGGVGIAPGANVADHVAVFEATHGTAPKYAGQNKVNPSSLLLSGVMMLEYMGWVEAADLINAAYPKVIGEKFVTYDFARQMDAAHTVSTSTFADALIARITGNAGDLSRFEKERREALEVERKLREARRISDPVEAMRESGRQPTTAAGIMSPVTKVAADSSVDEAMHIMREVDTSYVLIKPDVVTDWGIMTKRDVVTKILSENQSTAQVKVNEIASRPLISVPADTGLRAVSMVLSENNIRRVVVESKGEPVGVVADTDLFEVVQEFGWEPED